MEGVWSVSALYQFVRFPSWQSCQLNRLCTFRFVSHTTRFRHRGGLAILLCPLSREHDTHARCFSRERASESYAQVKIFCEWRFHFFGLRSLIPTTTCRKHLCASCINHISALSSNTAITLSRDQTHCTVGGVAYLLVPVLSEPHHLVHNALQRWEQCGVQLSLHVHDAAAAPHGCRGPDGAWIWCRVALSSHWARLLLSRV